MPRGGYRPGSGPKKGTKYKKTTSATTQEVTGQTLPPLPDNPVMPLEYMLRVLNDPNTPSDRKDKIAALAAPFCHAKADGKSGKKDQQADAAKEASKGRFGAMSGPKVVGIKR